MYNLYVHPYAIGIHRAIHKGIHMYICLKAVLYCPSMYPEVPGEMQIISASECLECSYQFYLRILSCMSVCCDITVGSGSDTGEGGKTVSE